MDKLEHHLRQRSRRSFRRRTGGVGLRRANHQRSQHHGFTLVELLIVIVLIAILASVSLISTDSSNSMSLDAAARMLSADLRLARNHAIKFNTKYKVVFDLDAQTYEIQHSGSGSLPVPKNNLASSAEDSDKYIKRMGNSSLNLPGEVFIRQIKLDTSQSNVTELEFGPMGGTGPARNEDTIIILAARRNNTTFLMPVTVSWVTGQTWVEEIESF